MSKRLCPILGLALCAACAVAAEPAASQAPAAAANAPAPATQTAGDYQRLAAARNGINQTTLYYEEIMERADGRMRQANNAFENSDFERARDLYVEVKNDLTKLNTKNLKVFNDRIATCTLQISKCYRGMAHNALLRADKEASVSAYDEAIRSCRSAIEFFPECKAEMEKKIEVYEEKRGLLVAAGEKITEAKLLPDATQREYQIQILMQRGREMAVRGRYAEARDYFQQVLSIDPYRADATQNLQAMNIRLSKVGDKRQLVEHNAETLRAKMEWLIPYKTQDSVAENALDQPIEREEKVESPLEKKLKSIVLPSINMEEIKIPKVVQFLREQSKQHDPEHVGINIFLRRNKEDSTEPNPEIVDKEVSFNRDSVPVGEAINMLCIAGNLQYRLERNAVIIESKDAKAGNLETKIFPIDQTLLKNGDSEDALKAYFVENGIPFPAGASVVYEARISRVIATNTPENLAKMEALISEMMSGQEPLVQLMVRIVLVNQSDLNQLAFTYLLANTIYDAENGPDFDTINLGNQLGSDGTGTVVGAVQFGDYTFGFGLSALNQLESKDVLASPRVLTLPDQPVSINFVRKLVFVEDYDDPEENRSKATGTGGTQDTYDYVGSFPNFQSDATDIGIQLSVTPKVDLESRTIQMPLSPKYSDLTKWYTFEGTADGGDTATYTFIKVPNISVYEATTEVTVLDGETVVIGGVVDDSTTTVLNKVPFLGDIPLLGRFFQTRSYKSDKKTMLIFITPTLVKPDGTPFFSESSAGNRGVVAFY